ncbi:uncharacterized protein M421DRAFT_88443 [Didymella exigua CBS 183.55]|uniref:Uncharacterized protein n=1 Tax=Didymella exigua CBS 183.55 TaxID=1150837 RepID=A0A6A5S0Q4_9PLEO|nr:uncharacterized protein M421DRAFT_88443 [Didymella exigua CBS 183.55]KAF1933170.1 hypothetical protein M421DRAFT_88443 [Didymella exigua CBS 183.55]
MSIPMTPAQASALPSALRNSIYSSLLSSGGIRSIEGTLTQLLQTSGFQAQLRAYIAELFRTGQATTAHDAHVLAMARIRECMRDDAGTGDGASGPDLRVPDLVVREGSRVLLIRVAASELLDGNFWIGTTGLELLDWNFWVRTTGLKLLDWNYWIGTTGLELLDWNYWIETTGLELLDWNY